MEELLLERAPDGVVVATLNRPDSLNAVSMGVQERLDAALTELEDDGETRCLVLAGNGRAFSAGYDVHEMADWSEAELLGHLQQRDAWVWHFASTPLPVVAAVHGVTYGIGAMLATAADVRCAAEDTEFKFTAAAHGSAMATWCLPPLVGHGLASELLLTSRPVSAREAQAIGLVNRVSENVLETALELAGQIAANPPSGPRGVKRLLREQVGRGARERFDAEADQLRPQAIPETYRDANGTFVPMSRNR